MATNTVIDGDFTEVKTEAAQETPETEAPVNDAPDTPVDDKKEKLVTKIGNGVKKYAPACVKALLGAGLIYGLYRVGKATANAAAAIPDTIKDNGREEIYTVITGSVPKDALNDAELERWNDAVGQLKSVMDDARTRLAVTATPEE